MNQSMVIAELKWIEMEKSLNIRKLEFEKQRYREKANELVDKYMEIRHLCQHKDESGNGSYGLDGCCVYCEVFVDK